MELGDRYLVVQRAAIGQMGRSNAGGGPGAPSDISSAVQRVTGTGSEALPTRVLQMLNMVSPEELVDDQDYEDIMEDTKDEWVFLSTWLRELMVIVQVL
jgi:splicing factor U2AF subunit